MIATFDRGEDGAFVFASEDEVLTPADTDTFLKRLNNELVRAQREVRLARRASADATKAYKKLRAPLLLSQDCPEVGRGAGLVTVEYRDAWINKQISDAYWAHRDALTALEEADGYMWLVKDQVRVMQSLNNNAKAIYTTDRGGR